MSTPQFRYTPSDTSTPVRLALLHGNGMCGAFYAGLAQEVALRGLSSTCFDLPGFAGSASLNVRGWDDMIEVMVPAVRAQIGDDGVLVGPQGNRI
jgi:alpha-beta hydrolase superfamily lysophospholipase